MKAMTTPDRKWVATYKKLESVDHIIAIIVICEKIYLSWLVDYLECKNPQYLDFAEQARIRYLSGLVALAEVIKRANPI